MGSDLPQRPDATPAGPTPLAPLLVFGFVNSLGTGAVTNGVYFLTREIYRFGDATNYVLGIVMGVSYIAGAVAIGPAIDRLADRLPGVTHRRILAMLMIVLGGACTIPSLGGASGPWAAWATVLIYGPVTGALWPIFESYLAGGRRDRPLRKTIGRFNITWALAVAASFWGMSAVIEHAPKWVFLGLGLVHIASLVLLRWFPPEPPTHRSDSPHETPSSYLALLPVFQRLLPLSYIALSALSPFLPTAMARVGLDAGQAVLLASVWMTARVGVFAVMQSWHGWRGQRWLAPSGAALLGLGFLLAIVAPSVLGEGAIGVAMMVLGLACFGAGMGVIYCAALYYAMTVGEAAVDAGGTHEALIGLGYTAGPLIMLLGTLADREISGAFEFTSGGLLVLCAGLACIPPRRGRAPTNESR